MGFPSKLKDLNYFSDGYSYRGVVGEVTVPKLTLKLEDWRGGGMIGDAPVTQGLDKLEMEFKAGGLLRSAFRQFGATLGNAPVDRFVGAYQDDESGRVQALEIVSRGVTSEIDMGGAKPGDDTEHTFKRVCTYYKLIIDGEVWIEIDILAGIFIVFGIDRNAEIRAAIGG